MSRQVWLSLGLFLAGIASGAEVAPEILGVSTIIIAPGAILTMAGGHLGTAATCTAPPSGVDPPLYPKQLCGTQVFVGDELAGLLYVSANQINFHVPKDSPQDGDTELRVVYNGQSGKPYPTKAGFDRMTIRLDQPAYTDMPVWLKPEFRSGMYRIAYPSMEGPAGFGCSQVEVRRDGKPLMLLPRSNWTPRGNNININFSSIGSPCGGYAMPPRGKEGRLPLHLLYRFEEPGVYEVRLTLNDIPFDGPSSKIRFQSEWTSIEVQPANHYQRAQWLDDIRSRHPMDANELLSDVLPSLLGLPDPPSLAILDSYLHHPDERVQRFAANGLYYWPDAVAPK